MHIPKAMNVVCSEMGGLLEVLAVKTVLPEYPCRCKCSRMSENRFTCVFYAVRKRVLLCLFLI